jgi:hypothetical protein
MTIMTTVKLSAQIRSIKSNSKKVREQIQEALISCAYYAAKDGNTNPFNQLLSAVGSATRIKGLTLWAETYGFVLVKNEQFALNKSARTKHPVLNEQDFEQYEKAMREAPMWFDMVPAEKAVSVFDVSSYLSNVIAKLEKENCDGLVPFLERAISEFNAVEALKALKAESEAANDSQTEVAA